MEDRRTQEKQYNAADEKIISRILDHKVHISFEVFPPRIHENYDKTMHVTEEIAKLDPAFISVTFRSGDGINGNTVQIASHIRNDLGVSSLAHLACSSTSRAEIHQVLGSLKENGISNVLALRGDIPQNGPFPRPDGFQYASELIDVIRSEGDFCIGAACYPEGHVDSANRKEDVRYLKKKVDCGTDFLITQMFFDNTILYNFLYRIREQGITIPVIPGIMPVTSAKQIKHICEISGTALPQRFLAIIDRFGERPMAMQQAGIAYATDQIIDLIANGINNIHIYSMNKPEVAAAIVSNLSEIIHREPKK